MLVKALVFALLLATAFSQGEIRCGEQVTFIGTVAGNLNDVQIGDNYFADVDISYTDDVTLIGQGNYIVISASADGAAEPAFLAQIFLTDGVSYVTNTDDWECIDIDTVTDDETLWELWNNNSAWEQADFVGSNDGLTPDLTTNVTDVSDEADWIWLNDGADAPLENILCRMRFICSDDETCGNGVLDSNEECDSGRGCLDDCTCDVGYEDENRVDCGGCPDGNYKMVVNILAEDSLESVWVGVHEYEGSEVWEEVETDEDGELDYYTFEGYGDFIVVEFTNSGSNGGFIADIDLAGSEILTSTDWLCADKSDLDGGDEYWLRDYDDSDSDVWKPAYVTSFHNDTISGVVPGISVRAAWISVEDDTTTDVVCRLLFTCSFAPCGDGVLDEDEECDSGKGCGQDCKCEDGWAGQDLVDCQGCLNGVFDVVMHPTAFYKIEAIQIGSNFITAEAIGNSTAWSSSGYVEAGGDYIAVLLNHTVTPGGDRGGFLAEINIAGAKIVTNTDWKCSADFDEDNWWRRTEEDDDWDQAGYYGSNDGKSPVWPEIIDGISEDAAWIWLAPDDGNEEPEQIVCRLLYICSQAPCGNGRIDDDEECDSGTGCNEECVCDRSRSYGVSVDGDGDNNVYCELIPHNETFAVGHPDSFVFFWHYQYCGGMYIERPVTQPAWLPLGEFSCLSDPMDLGFMGLRSFDEISWDPLSDFSFAISYTINTTVYDHDNVTEDFIIDDYSVVNSEVFCDQLEHTIDQETVVTYSAAEYLDTPGTSNWNDLFYWEAMDVHHNIWFRVLWDCRTLAEDDQCERTITVKNVAEVPIERVDVELAFDWDITPTRMREQIQFGVAGEFEEVMGYAPVRSVRVDEWLDGYEDEDEDFTSESRFTYFTNNDTDDVFCWEDSANDDFDWNENIEEDDLSDTVTGCDGGCAVQVRLADMLLPGEWYSIRTIIAIHETPAIADEAIDDAEDDDVAFFYCMGVNNHEGDAPDNRVIAAWVFPPERQCAEDEFEQEWCWIPGDCVCQNGGVCVDEDDEPTDFLSLECACEDRLGWGQWCQEPCLCSEHGACVDQTERDCTCDEGYCGEFCQNECDCDDDHGYCHPETCECFCEDGYHGADCSREWSCSRRSGIHHSETSAFHQNSQ